MEKEREYPNFLLCIMQYRRLNFVVIMCTRTRCRNISLSYSNFDNIVLPAGWSAWLLVAYRTHVAAIVDGNIILLKGPLGS